MRPPQPSFAPSRMVLWLALPLLACSLIIGVAGTRAAKPLLPRPALDRGDRIPWQDGSYFLSGVNYPQYLYYGGDIATLASVDADCQWYYSSSFNYAAIDRDFADMQTHGVHVVRWWLFGDGRGAPEFDGTGRVTGFDATFFDHMDQALQIAARHNIYIVWSLWDFLAFEPANWLCGGNGLTAAYAAAAKMPPDVRDAFLAHVKDALQAPPGWVPGTGSGDHPASGQQCMINAGGHRNLVTDTAPGGAQDSFFTHALIPMLQRYGSNPQIIGWEIMNEPEWALNNNPYTGQNPTVWEPVDVSQMRAYFARFTDAVHTYAPGQYATVGGASLKFMGFGQWLQAGLWTGLGFDYYAAHYYGWMDSAPANNANPLDHDYFTDPLSQQLDAPVVIGEFPANGGTSPLYLPSVVNAGAEHSTLSLRYICTAFEADSRACTQPYTATIEYNSFAGALVATQTVVLPPYGGWTGAAPAALGTFTGTARIASAGAVSAVLTQTGALDSSEEYGYAAPDQGALTTWLPRVVNLGVHRTRLAIRSTDVHTGTVSINYYDQSGAQVGLDTLTLGPRGGALIDPHTQSPPPGPPAGFEGSAVVNGTVPLAVVAADLDPANGSDAYTGEAQTYLHELDLPSIRNWGANGTPVIYLQNPCCAAATDTVRYYDSAGTLVATQSVSIPENGAAALHPDDVLTGGFEGAAVVSSDQVPAAVAASTTTSGTTHTLVLYAGTQNPDQRLQFPLVHGPDGSTGAITSFSAQNVNATVPITVWAVLHDDSGHEVYSHTTTIPPRGQWIASTSTLPGVPAGFAGTAEILWPWPNGWSQGFPLVATARDLDGTHTQGAGYRGIASHTNGWAVTRYTPAQLIEGLYDTHWAGGIAWSYYDNGTGSWADYLDASQAFGAAHAADVAIGHTQYTPIPTPGNGATATAVAATNTPAYGNGATATAQAGLTGTPQPTCAVPTDTPTVPPATHTPVPPATHTPAPTAPGCTINFSDVQPADYFYAPVAYLFCRGIVGGYADGTFRPYNDTTRGQFAKMLVLGLGWPITTPAVPTFGDVPATSPFFAVIETAYAHGAISGYSCGGDGEPCPGRYFRPASDITRGQISKLIALAMGWPLLHPLTPTFQDVPEAYPFYEPIETVYAHGVVSGYSCGRACLEFRPANPATRGQLSKMLWWALTHP